MARVMINPITRRASIVRTITTPVMVKEVVSVAAKQHFVPRAHTANPMTEDFAGSSHKIGKLCMSRGYNMPLDMPILLLAFHEA